MPCIKKFIWQDLTKIFFDKSSSNLAAKSPLNSDLKDKLNSILVKSYLKPNEMRTKRFYISQTIINLCIKLRDFSIVDNVKGCKKKNCFPSFSEKKRPLLF